MKRWAELAAKAREITGPACTSAEFRSSTCRMNVAARKVDGGKRLASLNILNGCLSTQSPA